MAIAFVAADVGPGGANDNTTPAINTTGANLLIVLAGSIDNFTAPTITDSKSNSWTALSTYNAGESWPTMTIFYSAGGTVGSGHTFTATASALFPSIVAMAFSGADTGAPFDGEDSGTDSADSTESVQPGSITPNTDNALVVTGLSLFTSTDDPDIDGGFTEGPFIIFQGSQSIPIASAYLIQTSAAAANPTWSWTGASTRTTAIASFKAAAAAAGDIAERSDVAWGDVAEISDVAVASIASVSGVDAQ